jgi:hypothetical protein
MREECKGECLLIRFGGWKQLPSTTLLGKVAHRNCFESFSLDSTPIVRAKENGKVKRFCQTIQICQIEEGILDCFSCKRFNWKAVHPFASRH